VRLLKKKIRAAIQQARVKPRKTKGNNRIRSLFLN